MCVLELSPMGSGVELFVARATFAYAAILKHFIKNVNNEKRTPPYRKTKKPIGGFAGWGALT